MLYIYIYRLKGKTTLHSLNSFHWSRGNPSRHLLPIATSILQRPFSVKKTRNEETLKYRI